MEHREGTTFCGTAQRPAEVELDEAGVKKVPVFDGNIRIDTMHHAIFGMKQRGSRKCVLYMLEPRFVPMRVDGSPASILHRALIRSRPSFRRTWGTGA